MARKRTETQLNFDSLYVTLQPPEAVLCKAMRKSAANAQYYQDRQYPCRIAQHALWRRRFTNNTIMTRWNLARRPVERLRAPEPR